MFGDFYSVTQIDWSAFGSIIDTSNVTDIGGMFYACSALTTLVLSNFDTSKMTDMCYMFEGCSALTTLDLSNFDTSKVTDMSDMFYECSALTSLDISNFDTSKVTLMFWMFAYCSKLSSLKLGRKFTIAEGCDTGYMLNGTPNAYGTTYCTITCTEATKAKLLEPYTCIYSSKYRWIIL